MPAHTSGFDPGIFLLERMVSSESCRHFKVEFGMATFYYEHSPVAARRTSEITRRSMLSPARGFQSKGF